MRKTIRLELSESFEKRPYRQLTEGLAIDDIPWIPLVGRNSFLRTATPSPSHTHAGCIEIVYCRHGTCEYESMGARYRLTPGHAFVSRSNEAHRMLSNPRGLATCYLLFRNVAGVSEEMLGLDLRFIERKLRKVPRLFECGSCTGSHFVRLFRLLAQSYPDRSEKRLRIANACLTLLLSVIDAAESTVSMGGVSDRISALAAEMREHPERSYPIGMLVERIGYSQTSLMNGFKAAIGYTPHAYLLRCRIERAKCLLSAKQAKVARVARALGFPSAQHFATQFRNATGLSPREWARASRQKKGIPSDGK